MSECDPNVSINWTTQAFAWAKRTETLDVVALMSLFVVLLVAHEPIYQLLAIACMIASATSRRIRRSPWIWFGIAAAFAPRLMVDWYHNEDHVYLAIYWCVAIGLALAGERAEYVLACNARTLIGLAFGFATLWKIISPQFLDGALCTYKLIDDYRFRKVMTQPIGGLTDDQVLHNHQALVALRQAGSPATHARLEYPERVVWMARALAYWTVLIEGTLAIAFLLPARWVRRGLRDASLLVFAATTYLVVPVLGFAVLLMAMGFAQTTSAQVRTRLAYLCVAWLVLMRFALIT